MTIARPLCSVCFRQPRAHQSARCADCGPGRLASSRRPLGDDQELDAEAAE